MTAALARRLGLIRTEVDVVLTGGVFKGYNRALLEDLIGRIHQRVPRAHVIKVLVPAVVGSALLGLDLLAGGQIGSRLKNG